MFEAGQGVGEQLVMGVEVMQAWLSLSRGWPSRYALAFVSPALNSRNHGGSPHPLLLFMPSCISTCWYYSWGSANLILGLTTCWMQQAAEEAMKARHDCLLCMLEANDAIMSRALPESVSALRAKGAYVFG